MFDEETRAAFGQLTKLEWSGRRRGPGTSMGAQNGTYYPACPECHQLQSPNGDFKAEAVGHKPDCQLGSSLRNHREAVMGSMDHGEYCGEMPALWGARALIRPDDTYWLPLEQRTLLAQFNGEWSVQHQRMSLLHPVTEVDLCYGWHEFPASAFKILVPVRV